MTALRILWICAHRTHRYEEVGLLLRAGAEVVPVASLHEGFPNAFEHEEELDPYYPKWRETLSMPMEIAERLRRIDYFAKHAELSGEEKNLINNWFDVVLIGSFTPIVVSFLGWFDGFVILRAFGGYRYSGVLNPDTRRGREKLDMISRSPKYIWCPILPYLTETEDPRVTRNEIVIPAAVSPERLPYRWQGSLSLPYVGDTISLIERYRSKIYADYLDDFGDLPLRILGNNEKTGRMADDARVVGSLRDDEYYKILAECRVMLYRGLGTRFHLHYHVIEALMMKMPVIFFANGSIAHVAEYYGIDRSEMAEMGMCESASDAGRLAKQCLTNIDFALALSNKQDPLRGIFSPDEAFANTQYLVRHMTLKSNYSHLWPGQIAAGLPADTRLISDLIKKIQRVVSR